MKRAPSRYPGHHQKKLTSRSQAVVWEFMRNKKVRSKHNNLLNFFLYDEKYLSKAYIKKCEEFIDSLGKNKLEDCFKMEVPKNANKRS